MAQDRRDSVRDLLLTRDEMQKISDLIACVGGVI